MDLYQLKIEFPAELADVADQVLLENGLESWSVLEDAIVKRAWLVGIFSEESEAKESWEMLRPLLSFEMLTDVEGRVLENRDWRDSYKAHFKAWKFGRLHWVPLWERETFQLPEGDSAIWLDPGLAFGTGNHETTRLCVERLVTLADERGTQGSVIDAGCGSGILALSAVKLGFKHVYGFDNDPEAVRVSEENAVLNDAEGEVRFEVADVTKGLSGKRADIILANIQADILIRFASELAAPLAPGGALILSGILASENQLVKDAFAQRLSGWKVEMRVLGEWSDLLFIRPS